MEWANGNKKNEIYKRATEVGNGLFIESMAFILEVNNHGRFMAVSL